MTEESNVIEVGKIFLVCAPLILTTQICLYFLYASVCISIYVNICRDSVWVFYMSVSFIENICSEIVRRVCNHTYSECGLVVTVYPVGLINQ